MQLYASKCKSHTVREAFEKAEQVFVGRMISSSTEEISRNYKREGFLARPNAKRYSQPNGTVTEVYYRKIYDFQPIKIWKGKLGEVHKIHKTSSKEDFEYFKKGQNYLFFSTPNVPASNSCNVNHLGTEMGYTITLLLDELTDNKSENLNKRTPDNTYVGPGLGIPNEEIRRRSGLARSKQLERLGLKSNSP